MIQGRAMDDSLHSMEEGLTLPFTSGGETTSMQDQVSVKMF